MKLDAIILIEAPGKIRAYSHACKAMGVSARIIPTKGHLFGYHNSMTPVGFKLTEDGLDDWARREKDVAASFKEALKEALVDLKPEGQILIASDNDTEGDVIALDMALITLTINAGLRERIRRMRPGAMTMPAIRDAIRESEPIDKMASGQSLKSGAIEGRLRAALDRWLGLALSRHLGRPSGRVRTSLLALASLWEVGARNIWRPEVGEILLRCRSEMAGRFAIATIPVHGAALTPRLERLKEIAEVWEGRPVPGLVYALQPAGAAIAPRFGRTMPMNTADILVTMSRQFGVPAWKTMPALQSAYMKGRITYPRTDSRAIDESQVDGLIRIASFSNVGQISREHLEDIRHDVAAHEKTNLKRPRHHGAILPVAIDSQDLVQLTDLMRKPAVLDNLEDQSSIEDLVVATITRRAVDNCRIAETIPGRWRAGQSGAALKLTAEDIEILADLDWEIEMTPPPPWSRMMLTGSRPWPLDAILIHAMAEEGLGRPSTWAGHVETVIAQDEIYQDGPFDIPRLRPGPRRALQDLPQSMRHPAFARMVQEGMEFPRPKERGRLKAAVLDRLAWIFDQIPKDFQKVMVDLLQVEVGRDGGQSKKGPVASATQPRATPERPKAAPVEIPLPTEDDVADMYGIDVPGIPEPTPL